MDSFAEELDGTRVFVPAPQSAFRRLIDPGSGIVGTEQSGRMLLIDYEGNRYGAANLSTLKERVRQAWGRHVERYPTVARSIVPLEEMLEVGSYDPDRDELHLTEPALVADWCVEVPA